MSDNSSSEPRIVVRGGKRWAVWPADPTQETADFLGGMPETKMLAEWYEYLVGGSPERQGSLSTGKNSKER